MKKHNDFHAHFMAIGREEFMAESFVFIHENAMKGPMKMLQIHVYIIFIS